MSDAPLPKRDVSMLPLISAAWAMGIPVRVGATAPPKTRDQRRAEQERKFGKGKRRRKSR